MSVPAYLKYIGLTVLFIVAAVNFTRTTFSVIESSKRLEELRGRVDGLEEQKVELESEVEYRQTDEFVEQEARDKLGFVKAGEEIFVIKDVLGVVARRDNVASASGPSSIPQAWLALFR